MNELGKCGLPVKGWEDEGIFCDAPKGHTGLHYGISLDDPPTCDWPRTCRHGYSECKWDPGHEGPHENEVC